MSSSPKMESIFFIVAALDKMEYKFENEMVLEVLEKLVITMINLLVCYLIIEVRYVRLLVITKLIFISITFKVSGEASCTYDGLVNLEEKQDLVNVF